MSLACGGFDPDEPDDSRSSEIRAIAMALGRGPPTPPAWRQFPDLPPTIRLDSGPNVGRPESNATVSFGAGHFPGIARWFGDGALWVTIAACGHRHGIVGASPREKSREEDQPEGPLLAVQLAVKDDGCWARFATEASKAAVKILARTSRGRDGVREVAEVQGSPEQLRRFTALMVEAPGTESFRFTSVDSNRLLGLVDCRRCAACRVMSRYGMVLLEASCNGGGELVLTVISPDGTALQQAVLRMQRAGLDIRILKLCSASAHLDGNGHLTPHQHDILAMALSHGYYENPKKIRLADLGKEFGISKASAAEVLRRAERTLLIQAVAPETAAESTS